ncbi:MAG: CotH kinase family protein [Rhodothermales bacterium]
MKLKVAQAPSPLRTLLTGRTLSIGGVVALMVCLSALTFWIGALLTQRQAFDPEATASSLMQAPVTLANRVESALLARPEQIAIDIKHTDFQWIAYKRETALRMGQLIASDDDYVPARLTSNGKTYDVTLRLKGDLVDHLAGDKWSFRVHVKGDQTVFGMNTFSIQDPGTRNYLAEWVYHRALEREDVLSLRYDFIGVTINGKYMGIYALEEHFDKRLIEHRNRREGPILRFSEQPLWDDVFDLTEFKDMASATSSTFEATYIDAFKSQSIQRDPVQYNQYLHALSLLTDFRSGAMPAHAVFDVERMARFMALSELLGSKHGAVWRNIRFYYNPITARIEPIGYDALSGTQIGAIWASGNGFDASDYPDALQRILLQDTTFFAAYVGELERVADPAYFAGLQEDLRDEWVRKERIVHLDNPEYAFPYASVDHNRRLIDFGLHPVDALRAHLLGHDSGSVQLELAATHFLPVYVDALALNDRVVSRPAEPAFLPARNDGMTATFSSVSFPLPDSIAASDSLRGLLTVRYHLLGSDSLKSTTIFPYPSVVRALVDGDPTRDEPNAHTFPFLRIDEAARRVTVPAGDWRVGDIMILPTGYTFLLEAGAHLDLSDSAFVLARGPVVANGTEADPVRFGSADSTGQGLVVLQAGEESTIRHALFDGLGSAGRGAWNQTGAVVFYESPVRMEHVAFTRSRSEDALNIVRTRFSLEDALFRDTRSDAFDGDFVEGVVRNARFERLGNDGIDISGSQVRAVGIHVRGAGDKALSAGEYSVLEADSVTIVGSAIAIASKDKSVVTLRNASIIDSRLGFAIFQKKSEFGPASAEAYNLRMDAVETPLLLETGSSLFINGALQRPTGDRVGDLLYGHVYGKASE